jgi:hypothetical protein
MGVRSAHAGGALLPAPQWGERNTTPFLQHAPWQQSCQIIQYTLSMLKGPSCKCAMGGQDKPV